jgi:2,3-bisphosphoglycerate-independent phosphoglycerate mutase
MGRATSKKMGVKKPVVLIVLDGFGIRKSKLHNAVLEAKTPNLDFLFRRFPNTNLHASGEFVGLPKGTMGNSETGHMHLGAGRVIKEAVVRINDSIRDGSFYRDKVLLDAMRVTKKNHSSLHLMGLISDSSVHSHIDHLFALLKMAEKNGVKQVYIHCFLDGRDTPPRCAKRYISKIVKTAKKLKTGEIVSLIGRFYAMDRDNRWNREHKAYDAMVNGKANFFFDDPFKAVDAAYLRGESDEFVQPTLIRCGPHKDIHLVKPHDAVIFFNFRSDRAREITRAFVEGKFNKFKRRKIIDLHFVCLTQYDDRIRTPVAFKPHVIKDTLGEMISKKGLRQLRLAETEKYAHVTFFFNCGKDGPHPKEDRILIPSPKIKTYDHAPSMSAFKIAKTAVKNICSRRYSLVVINFANCDMVGHSGNERATIKGIAAVDRCVKIIVDSARKSGYSVVLTADHGNAEDMTEGHSTAHTTNDVPVLIIDDKVASIKTLESNGLYDVAPTILDIMGLPKPKDMTGKSMLKKTGT